MVLAVSNASANKQLAPTLNKRMGSWHTKGKSMLVSNTGLKKVNAARNATTAPK